MFDCCLSHAARCLRFCAAILLVLAGTAHAAPFAYITNQSSDTVSVIDTATNTVVATVAVGDNPVRRRRQPRRHRAST